MKSPKQPSSLEDSQAAREDAVLYGTGFLVEGKRVDPKTVTVIFSQRVSMAEWILAAERMPESEPGLWSQPVIVLMASGDIFKASCMGDYWQRLSIMEPEDSVQAWMPIPKMPGDK